MNTSIPTLCMALLLAARVAAADTHFEFEAFLDAKPIGSHRFEIRRSADGTEAVRSVAAFDVRILGFTAYRYRHQASEGWKQGCLVRMESSTDDNGRASRVSRDFRDGCVASYAYWDRAHLLGRRELLNPQTGQFDQVRMELLAEEALVVRGVPLRAEHYRLDNGKLVIDLWYSKSGDWLQLDSTTPSKRKLHYRLAGIVTTNSAPSVVSSSASSPP